MIKYKCKSLFHFISSTLLLNNINEEWRKMNVKNSSQNTVKKYEELTFTDDFMFCKVMQNNPDLCKHLIELIIGKKITIITYPDTQKAIEITADGKGIRMDSENVSSEVYIELEKRGYKTYLLSAKKEKKLINSVDVIPEIVINNKGYNREKILKFNHYIKQVEIIEHPDLIIVEAPGNLLEISKMVTGDFGSGAYIISRGISLDYVICNMPYFSGFSEKCDDLGQCIEARIEAEVDAYNITSQYLDLADAEENGVIEYMDVSRDLIVDEIKNNEKIYYLQEKMEISRVVDDIIKKLESYAEIELI